ncbi:unnamed protein product [Haemonchus placei]|uniref:Reverse transcriptase domain-containing protein n=1 Tax=Haemonchus placei TaxID=6290 RepID=A0A0N4X7A2_HAEPC|nr:unnamed protein product [Haemonchus placei]
MRNLFSFINKRMGNKKHTSLLRDFDGNALFSAQAKANVLGDYFASVYTVSKNSVGALASGSRVEKDCPLPVITFDVVYKCLRGLKRSSALPSDGIPPIFFKMFASNLASPLCHIFDISLIVGQVPLLREESIVTAVPKSSASLPSEFRPISITPTPCTLELVGIRGNLSNWLKSYLPDRCLCVKFEDAFSRKYPITSGVPQGGVLFPLLFIIYTLQLPCALLVDPSVKVFTFAGDVKVTFRSDKGNLVEAERILDRVIDSMSTWTDNMNLKLNFGKTCCHLVIGQVLPP